MVKKEICVREVSDSNPIKTKYYKNETHGE